MGGQAGLLCGVHRLTAVPRPSPIALHPSMHPTITAIHQCTTIHSSRSFFRKAGSDSESSSDSEEELLQSSDDENSDRQTSSKPVKASAGGASKTTTKSTGSKFLRGAGSDSSDDDSSESESDSDEDSDEDSDAAGPATTKKKPMASKFLKGTKDSDDSSSDDDNDNDEDEDTVKVVKSAKTKRMDEMEHSEKSILNAERIGDWGSANSGGSISQTTSIKHAPYI